MDHNMGQRPYLKGMTEKAKFGRGFAAGESYFLPALAAESAARRLSRLVFSTSISRSI